MQPAPESLNFVVADMARLFRSGFEHRVAEAGLGVTPAEARVLAHLRRTGPIRQHLLADRLCVAQMSLCGFLDRLEQAGLVQRAPDPDDRRAKRVHLTDAAGPVLDQIAAIGAEMRTLARAGMSDTEWETFAAAADFAYNGNMSAAVLVSQRVIGAKGFGQE